MRSYLEIFCCLTIFVLQTTSVSFAQEKHSNSTHYGEYSLTKLRDNIRGSDTFGNTLKRGMVNSNVFNQITSGGFLKQLQIPLNFSKPVFEIKEARFTTQLTNSFLSDGYFSDLKVIQTVQASTSISLYGVPFALDYTSNSGWKDNLSPLNFGNAKFNKETFLAQIREKIQKSKDPENLFRSFLSPLYSKRDHALNTIRADLLGALNADHKDLIQEYQRKINIENISFLGMDQFLNQIVSEMKNSLLKREDVLYKLKNEKNYLLGADSILNLSNEIERLRSSQNTIEHKISGLRSKWLGAGLTETIGGFDKEKQRLINNLLKDPSVIAQIANKHLKLPGIQKVLLNTKIFNAGTSGISQSNLNFKDVLLKGLNSEFLKGQKFIAPILGVQPGIKNITDFNFSNYAELPNIITTSLRTGKGDIQKNFSHISVSLFQQNNNNQFLTNGFQGTQSPKNIVTTFSKRLSLGTSQTLLAEISKSTMLYAQMDGKESEGISSLINGNNVLANMGVNLVYDGEFEKLGLNNKTTIRYTGQEYVNHGNYSLASGAKELSNDIKKMFLNRKLILHVKANYREYTFSAYDRKWISFSYLADVKWKLKKGEFIEIRYQPYFNKRSKESEDYLNSQSHRIAIRGNLVRKVFGGASYKNFIELSGTNDGFYDIVADKVSDNRFFSYSSLQTLVFKKQTIFLNVTGSKAERNTGYLFGNSFVSIDAGLSFNLFRNIFLSSSLVYNQVSELYTQLSVRQSLSAILLKRISVEGFLQTGKNIYEADGFNMPVTTGNLAISYNIK